jgi:hypothetical protein
MQRLAAAAVWRYALEVWRWYGATITVLALNLGSAGLRFLPNCPQRHVRVNSTAVDLGVPLKYLVQFAKVHGITRECHT